MNPIIVDIDDLADFCGYYTEIDDLACCNHSHCKDSEIVKIFFNDGIEKEFLTGSIANYVYKYIRSRYPHFKSLKTDKIFTRYFNKIQENVESEEFLKLCSLKRQGICYGGSCPIAERATLEAMKEYDKDLYDEWRDSEDSAHNLMLIDDPELIKPLHKRIYT